MTRSADTLPVYLEIGAKRTFAGALDWPGWCRRGTDEASALQALVDYRDRYAKVLATTTITFHPPNDVSACTVVERLQGNDATDFGAANIPPLCDAAPLDSATAKRSRTLLEAVWHAFDQAIAAGTGKELSVGPRGGGRGLDGIVRHILDADAGYLSKVAHRVLKDAAADLPTRLAQTRQTMLDALDAGERGEIPEFGPRGGTLWTARYFVRRVAWHTLDHTWEIEDRIMP